MIARYSSLMLIMLVCIGFLGISFYGFCYKRSQIVNHRIALFIPAVHPAMDDIVQGFKDSFQGASKSYIFDIFNANGNKTLLRGQAEEIVGQGYDLIFTIGTQCSHTIYNLTNKKGLDTPVVFCAIEEPVKLGLVQSLEHSGNHVTGTTTQDDFNAQFDALLRVKPNTKHVLFVYDPSHGSGLDVLATTISQTIQKRGLQLSCVQVFQSNEIQQKVMPFIEATDVVFMYTDHTAVSGIDSLIALCNRYQKTLFASDLNSADKGAALAFGVREYDHGLQAGKKAYMILEDGKKPFEISITPVCAQYLKVNTKTMKQQGLVLTQQDLEKVKAAGGFII